jgi:hypothetical protein
MAGRAQQPRLSHVAIQALRIALVLVVACSAPPAVAPAAPTASAALPTAFASSTPSAPPSRTSVGSRVGACTDPQTSSRGVIERYFALSTSGDAAAVNDCFTAAWRARNADFDEGAERWAVSGPVTDLQIGFLDRTLGCDRYSINAKLAIGAFGFYALVGLDGDRQRIHETGTALVRPELATTRCGS